MIDAAKFFRDVFLGILWWGFCFGVRLWPGLCGSPARSDLCWECVYDRQGRTMRGIVMRLDKPRVDPVPGDQLSAEVREKYGEGEVANIFRTLAHHPKLLKRWTIFANHVLMKSTLAARERELVILRIGWLCQAEYEWAQHALIGRGAGLTAEEIVRITQGPDATGWDERDQALLRATDDLHGDAFVSDATWQALSAHYDTEQLLDILFTIGQYQLVSGVLNSLGVQLDEGLTGFPET